MKYRFGLQYCDMYTVPGTDAAVAKSLAQIGPWSRNYEVHDIIAV